MHRYTSPKWILNEKWRAEMESVLIVEDDVMLREELCSLLRQNGFEVEAPEEFSRIPELVRDYGPDMVLLDIQLESANGLSICSKIRESSDVPIIFVTGRTSPMDELECLTRGGDDFIEKPYQAPILLAHIRAVLRRANPKMEKNTSELVCRGVRLLVPEGRIEYQGKQEDLTKNELKILYYLFEHQEEIVSRADLTEYLWDQDVFIDDNALSVHMTRIRSKLSSLGVENLIKTKRGMGYQI